jgi:cell surface protein
MKKLFICLSVLGMILMGCSKNDDEGNGNSNDNGNEQPENPNEPELPELPALPNPDDVCSAMDDINFMAYCYENFDVNKDGKVSVNEANAVREINVSGLKLVSLKGIERFSNLESLNCRRNPIISIDVRYNTRLINLDCAGTHITTIDLSRNKAMTEIKEKAFYESKLMTINIPAHIESIGVFAFSECESLESVVFESNSKIKELGSHAIYGEGGDYIFSDCKTLTKVILPDNITQIGYGVFYNTGLERITLPSTLQIIGDSAFYHANLKEVVCYATIPPKFYSNTFSYYNYNFGDRHVILYVPEKSVDIYKEDRYWKMFSEILPIK